MSWALHPTTYLTACSDTLKCTSTTSDISSSQLLYVGHACRLSDGSGYVDNKKT